MTSRDDAVRAVVAAWRDKGPGPWVHLAAVSRLWQMWPTLARAVEALAEAGEDNALLSTLRLLAEERARAERAEARIAKVREFAQVQRDEIRERYVSVDGHPAVHLSVEAAYGRILAILDAPEQGDAS